ncbi:DUF6132 family protein [candidate division KSB1 bacterium]
MSRKGGFMLLTIVGVLVGAGAGVGFYFLVGCRTGACPLTSNPVSSALYGALMGFLFTRLGV